MFSYSSYFLLYLIAQRLLDHISNKKSTYANNCK